jgi:hypothetical protein
MSMTLDLLKRSLSLRHLDETLQTELHTLVLHEAAAAECLAARTPYPLLLFPCLFEERVAAALERERTETKRYWRRMGIAA